MIPRLIWGCLGSALLAVLALLGAACQVTLPPPSKEYQGTIYFTDSGIWKLELQSKTTSRLSDQRTVSPLELSPDQQWLLYKEFQLSGSQVQSMSLWVVPSGGGRRTPASGEIALGVGQWLPDSQLLYTEFPNFHADRNTGEGQFGAGHTFVFDPRTERRRTAQDFEIRAGCITKVSPKHDEKAESCPPDIGEKLRGILRVAALDGSQPITVTESYIGGSEFQWSSDGERILFADGPVGGQKLQVWSRQDRSVRQIKGQVEGTGFNFIAVSWSPDGRWVAFDGPGNDLCVVLVADGAVKCFKGYLSDVGALPAWSPASNAIVVSSNHIGQILMRDTDLQWDLFIIGIPDGEVTRITNNPEQEQNVIWRQ